MNKFWIFTFAIFIAMAGTADARELRFEASLDKPQVAIGTAAKLGLSFYGTQSIPAPDLGNIDGLEVRYMGPSTMMTVLNGQVSSSITHMYSVLPLRLGKFQLGPFAFTFKGDDYKSNMVLLEVTETRPVVPKAVQKQDEAMPINFDLDDRIFLTLEASKQVAYVNELIPVTVKLYVNRMNVSDIQLPAFAQESFSKIEFKEPKQYKENMNGSLYDVLEFSTSIFGTKPGDYKLGPALIKANVVVKRRAAKRSSGDPFSEDFTRDSFFDDFFTRYERHPVELKSQDIQISVLPLPAANRPANFSGAVGDYQFIYAASPTKLKAGDPVTLKMEINGTGNLNTVLMPNMAVSNGFKP
ncbi:MAG: BatD family protein [Candidatus Omnitrophota bacterium]